MALKFVMSLIEGAADIELLPESVGGITTRASNGLSQGRTEIQKQRTKLISDFSPTLFCALVEQRSFRHELKRRAYFSPI